MISDLQRASMWKRISAFLFDLILLCILAVFFAALLSAALGYDGYQSTFNEAYDRYYAEYGLTEELLTADPATLSDGQIDQINAASAAIAGDETAVHAYNMVISLQLLIVTFGLLLAFLVLEYTVPLLLGNGQTLGKKIFGVGLMHLEGVRIGHVALFIRAILGKYAVGTMPFAMCAMYLVSGLGSPVFLLIGAVLLLAQLIVLIVSRENAMLHDKMAVTAAVDISSQRIFNTREELLEYKKKLHAEKAAAQQW